ncbi:MAG: MarR family winged helix-turn-helix transcriptional regulator [Acidimicrobiales bacterium]
MTATPELGIGWLIGAVHRRLRAGWSERLEPLGLNPPAVAAIRMIRRQPGCGLRELARMLEVEPINLSRTLEHLDEEGLVERRARPEDRRTFSLNLSERGVAVAGQLDELAREFEREMVIGLGEGADEIVERMSSWLTWLRQSE